MSVAAFQHRLLGVGNRIVWRAEDVARLATRFGVGNAAFEPSTAPPPPAPAAESIETRAAADDGTFTFTISTKAVDRMTDTVDPAGWKLDNFKRNPVVFWSHLSVLTPIGRATRTWLEGGRVKSTVRLAPAAVSTAAEEVRGLIAGGYLAACSVGFLPLEWSFSKDPARQYGVDFKRQELLEWSICSVPANPECLIDPGQAGKALLPSDRARLRRQRDLEVIRLRAG